EFGDCVWVGAFRLEIGGNDEFLSAFRLFRSRRTVRRPRRGGEFRSTLAQQLFERLLTRYAGKPTRLGRQIGTRQSVFRVCLFQGRRWWRLVVANAQLLRELRIKSRNWRGRIVALRRFVEFPGSRFARLVSIGKIAAAVPRIIRGRLQSCAGTQARGAAPDTGIEQVGERIRGGLVVGTCGLGTRWPRGILFRLVGGFGHYAEYGASPAAGKEDVFAREAMPLLPVAGIFLGILARVCRTDAGGYAVKSEVHSSPGIDG